MLSHRVHCFVILYLFRGYKQYPFFCFIYETLMRCCATWLSTWNWKEKNNRKKQKQKNKKQKQKPNKNNNNKKKNNNEKQNKQKVNAHEQIYIFLI